MPVPSTVSGSVALGSPVSTSPELSPIVGSVPVSDAVIDALSDAVCEADIESLSLTVAVCVAEALSPPVDSSLGPVGSVVADMEDASLVNRRVEAVKQQLTEAWEATPEGYPLTIESEIFWRRGAPPEQPDVRPPESR